ncbi:MAG: hypothetical protein ACI978_002684 [Oleispira sp.]|jgi:hypothetical protein
MSETSVMGVVENMDINVKEKFESYPDAAKFQLLIIRAVIFEVAQEESLGNISESLKWNEPSYQSVCGSAIRIDWKAKCPDTISVYFNCKTSLVDTFKEIYADTFTFVGNREIIFPVLGEIPMQELKACISMAHRYKDIKHLPLLGA